MFSILKDSLVISVSMSSITYLIIFKSLTELSSFGVISILYLKDTSASVASITKSKYPILVGAITFSLICSVPGKLE